MNFIEFTVLKAFTSEFKLRPCQSLQWNVCAQAAQEHYVWVRASAVIWSEYTRIISVLSDAK